MRLSDSDILIDDLLCEKESVRQGVDPSKVMLVSLREQVDADSRQYVASHCAVHQKITYNFLRLFSPEHVISSRFVYEIKEGEKNYLYSLTGPFQKHGLRILDSRDYHLLSEADIVSALSVLFFLNQSYANFSFTEVNMYERCKVVHFDDLNINDSLSEDAYDVFCSRTDLENDAVKRFLLAFSSYRSTGLDSFSAVFKKKKALAFLSLVISPRYIHLFDLTSCSEVERMLEKRRDALREILLNSEHFFEVLSELSPLEYREYFHDLFVALKEFDPHHYQKNSSELAGNALSFFIIFFKNKFDFFAINLQRELFAVSLSDEALQISRISNVLKIKLAINQMYLLLSESHFFDFVLHDKFYVLLSIINLLNTLFLFLDSADFHRKQMTKLFTIFQNVIASHEVIQSVLPKALCDQFDEPLDAELIDLTKINLDHMVEYSQGWLGRTAVYGLRTVLENKSVLVTMFDRALLSLRADCSASSVGSVQNPSRVFVVLREELLAVKTQDDVKKMIYRLIKFADRRFLVPFFRELILYCDFEHKFNFLFQKFISSKSYDVVLLSDQVRQLFLIPLLDDQVGLFWNKLRLALDSLARESEWCLVDLELGSDSRVLLDSVSSLVTTSSFFKASQVGKVVMANAERFASKVGDAAASESGRRVSGSIKSFVASGSGAVAPVLDSAQEVVSSVSSLLGAWWHKSA